MRAKKIIFAVMAISGSLSVGAQGAANLAKELMELPTYRATATFEVLLPQAMDPVVYDVALESRAVGADTLSPCDYLIQWSTPTTAGINEGFTAYYDGHHYRYRNNRLQEYHATANIDPFQPLGPGSERKGVQYTAQFADMLPQLLGDKIEQMISDTTYLYVYHPDTIVSGKRSVVIDGVKRSSGYDQMAYSYTFDYDTYLPVSADIESSPGSISEQLLTITYNASTSEPVEISEESLMERWPDVFERYRQSTFRAENLVNTPLPAFACQILDGGTDRYTHHLNEGFGSPVVLVVLDPTVATTKETIAAIREAVDTAPMDIEVVWAFNSNNTTEVTDAVGRLRPGETALTSANTLVRNCGITLYPTTILVDRSSKVHDVISGHNKELGLVVLQKAMLLK